MVNVKVPDRVNQGQIGLPMQNFFLPSNFTSGEVTVSPGSSLFGKAALDLHLQLVIHLAQFFPEALTLLGHLTQLALCSHPASSSDAPHEQR